MKKKSRLQSRFCWMYALYFGGYMSFFSFYGVLLRQHGAGAASLGVLSAGTAAANLLSLVVSGHLADRMRASKKILLVSGGLSAVWGLFLLGAIPSLAATWAVIIPVSCFDYALIGMLDAMTNTAARSGAGVQYSSARAWGALSGAVISNGAGAAFTSNRHRTDRLVPFGILCGASCCGVSAAPGRGAGAAKAKPPGEGKNIPWIWTVCHGGPASVFGVACFDDLLAQYGR